MRPSERNELRQIIAQQLEHLADEIQALEKRLEPIAPDCSLGRLTRFEAMGEQQIAEHALLEAQKRYHRLSYACRKIEEEGFGICSECDEPIALERLRIVPESTLCIACANERG